MRAFMEAIVHDTSRITDELIQQRIDSTRRSGVAEAQAAFNAARQRYASDPN
jgi:hypothetical protein